MCNLFHLQVKTNKGQNKDWEKREKDILPIKDVVFCGQACVVAQGLGMGDPALTSPIKAQHHQSVTEIWKTTSNKRADQGQNDQFAVKYVNPALAFVKGKDKIR